MDVASQRAFLTFHFKGNVRMGIGVLQSNVAM